MSIIYRVGAEELSDTTLAELYEQLGMGDTPQLFNQPYRIDTEHDIPTGAGNSIDRKTVYVDRTLYAEVMDGKYEATGLTPDQIIGRWCKHEHGEKCLVDGDNQVDSYNAAHRRILAMEHADVLTILCPPSAAKAREYLLRYEETIWPGLVRCYHRAPRKVPVDYWCTPLVDDPTERDEQLLEEFRRLGVIDAGKRSKREVHYAIGPNNCDSCSGWYPELISQERGNLAACRRINGLVRHNRTCEMWRAKQ